MTDIIKTEGLTKTYDARGWRKTPVRALDQVSIEVAEGEIFGFLGPNGAGKSTFVKILLGITLPSAGNAHIMGSSISDPKTREIIGFLPEQLHYPQLITADGFLRMCGKLNGMREPLLSTRIGELLKIFDLEQWRKTRLRKYSKGMLQRIGIAQALISQPKVLFLDEPSDGLDPLARKNLRDLLMELRNNGTTIFLNSHLLSEVEVVANRVAIINKGKVLKVGTTDELTQARGGFIVTVHQNNLPLSDLSGKRNLRIEKTADLVTIEVPSPDDLSSLLDLLKSAGVPIKSILPKKTTLEDSFISLIKNELPA